MMRICSTVFRRWSCTNWSCSRSARSLRRSVPAKIRPTPSHHCGRAVRSKRLELQPVSRVESDELLESVLGAPVSADCAGRMWKLTRGNVLFLRHLVEQERESGRLVCERGEWRWTGTPLVSPSLTELVELDIGAVPDDVQEVVDLVAIAEPIDRSILASLATREAIEAAEDRGLISASSTGDAVYVGHPLYAEVRLNRSGPLRLRRLRGSIATAMTRLRSQADPLRLGLLWLESDLPPDPGVLSRAANIAASRLDLGLAERLARAAVDASPSAATKLQLAYILFMREKGTDAEELLDTIEAQHAAGDGLRQPRDTPVGQPVVGAAGSRNILGRSRRRAQPA